MKASEELSQLVTQGDTIGNLCQYGCDIMYKIADFTGYTYYQVNIFILYILQPILLFLPLFLIYTKLIIKNKGQLKRIAWFGIICLNALVLINYLIKVFNQNWNELGYNIVEFLQNFSHTIGLNYAEINILQFIIAFAVLFIINMIYLCICNKTSWLRLISLAYWLPGLWWFINSYANQIMLTT